jgi:hypothetical protein
MHLSEGAQEIDAKQLADWEDLKKTIASQFFTLSASLKSHVSLLLLQKVFHLFFEISNTAKSITCDSYAFKADYTGADPNHCRLSSTAIDNPKTTITIDPAVDPTTMMAVDISDNAGVSYLPINIATNFPNIKYLQASRTSVREITYANFKGLVNLQFLIMEAALVQTLTMDMFKDLTKLIYVNMSKILLFSNF